MAKPAADDRSVCHNRKARFRYEIIETLECGLELQGAEVKSLRERLASIEEAYARIDGDELWLVGAHIAPYPHAPAEKQDPIRKRKLLAHRREIQKLRPKLDQKGLTLVPMRIYFNDRGMAKVSVGLARGKTMGDKRESLRAREHSREMQRALRGKGRG